eukprot:COSAG02_NODE_47241_length_342_cov_1.329218_1_plen_85_part_10
MPLGPNRANNCIGYSSDIFFVVACQIRGIKHNVLALDCSPGRYPAARTLDPLSQYLKWSATITSPAFDFIDANLPRPFIALHFRH